MKNALYSQNGILMVVWIEYVVVVTDTCIVSQ